MEKKNIIMKIMGAFLIIFVIWNYLIIFPYAFLSKSPDEAMKMIRFTFSNIIQLSNNILPFGTINTLGISQFAKQSQFFTISLFILRRIMPLFILISGIGLILQKEFLIKFALFAVIIFILLNGINLVLLFILYLPKHGSTVIPTLIKQIIFTIIFGCIAFYLIRPKVKELFR